MQKSAFRKNTGAAQKKLDFHYYSLINGLRVVIYYREYN